MTEMLTAAGFRAGPARPVRHSDWLRSSAKLAVGRGTAAAWQRPLVWKPLAKAAAWLTYVVGGSDCMMVVAERPVA
jgi:hypothetical protein